MQETSRIINTDRVERRCAPVPTLILAVVEDSAQRLKVLYLDQGRGATEHPKNRLALRSFGYQRYSLK